MTILFRYLKHYKWLLILALVLAAINQGFSLLDPQVFRLIIDRYVTNIATLDTRTFVHGVLGLIGISVLIAFISRVAKNFQDYYVNVVTERLGTKLYADSVGHAFSLPYSVFEDERSGELLQKLQKARSDSQRFIQAMINIVFLSFIGILFVVIYAFTVHYLVALAYLLIIPLLGGTIFFISKKIKVAQENIVKESAILAGSTTETLRNVELVKSLGLEDQELRRLNGVNEMILSLELKKVKLIRTLSFIQGTLINLLRAGILFLLLFFVFKGKMTFGDSGHSTSTRSLFSAHSVSFQRSLQHIRKQKRASAGFRKYSTKNQYQRKILNRFLLWVKLRLTMCPSDTKVSSVMLSPMFLFM